MLDDMLSANLPIAPQTHFAALSRWLEMESRAERQRLEERREVQSSAAAERSGETLLDLSLIHNSEPTRPY